MNVIPLNWKEKLSPFSNPDIAWFYLFLPALVYYLYLLSSFVNEKPFTGSIEIIDNRFNKIIYPKHSMEIITSGLGFTEGPVWINDDSNGYLLFSDLKSNSIYRYDEGKGFFTVGRTLFLTNSGCISNLTYCDEMNAPGSNGIIRMTPTKANPTHIDLLVAQHGERAISLIRHNGTRQFIATNFKGRRFNSPNDLILSPEGNLYFTDPKYGLYTKSNQSIEAELPITGIYMISSKDLLKSIESGKPVKNVTLLSRDLEYANGLAFSPDYSKLYVSNSDPKNPIYKVYDVMDDGVIKKGKLFFNATSLYNTEGYGLPDGMKVDINGNIFATGPGGVLVLSSEGELIGRFKLDKPASNVAFGDDGRIYFTNRDQVVRIWIKSRPLKKIK